MYVDLAYIADSAPYTWEKQLADQNPADARQRSLVECKCGEKYCSENCRKQHWEHSHELLCCANEDLMNENSPVVGMTSSSRRQESFSITLLLVSGAIGRVIDIGETFIITPYAS